MSIVFLVPCGRLPERLVITAHCLFQCPIFDTQRDVVYGNQYQTMTLKAGITVRVRHHP